MIERFPHACRDGFRIVAPPDVARDGRVLLSRRDRVHVEQHGASRPVARASGDRSDRRPVERLPLSEAGPRAGSTECAGSCGVVVAGMNTDSSKLTCAGRPAGRFRSSFKSRKTRVYPRRRTLAAPGGVTRSSCHGCIDEPVSRAPKSVKRKLVCGISSSRTSIVPRNGCPGTAGT